MTREEQIIEAGIDFTLRTRPMCIGGAAFDDIVRELNRNKSFEEGAKWADKTMIEKACMWLEMRFDEYIVREFRKAMEELC